MKKHETHDSSDHFCRGLVRAGGVDDHHKLPRDTVITLDIPRATPSINVMFGQHWAKRTKSRKEWGWLVRQARLNAKVYLTHPLPRARVTITRHGRRVLDTDNLYGGQKILIDCLVREGILKNDTPDHVELIVRQLVVNSPKATKTIVQIETLSTGVAIT